MRRTPILILALGMAAASLPAHAAGEHAFGRIAGHYDAIHDLLVADSTDGVRPEARAIARIARDLSADFSAAGAGVAPTDAAEVRGLLDEVSARAEAVAGSSGLEATRSALAELTKPLVRWHRLVEGARPVVAYCPMVKRAWLQEEGAIANPYDPSMLRCGEVVQR